MIYTKGVKNSKLVLIILRGIHKTYAEIVEFILRPYQNNSFRWCDFSKSAFQWVQKQKVLKLFLKIYLVGR